jgi:uncharacterized Zn-binding protein involved in type VI secretion
LAAAGGAGLGGIIGEFAAGFTTSDTGAIVGGSEDTVTNVRRAARATDMVACSWHGGNQKVAEGSASVLINGMPAARVGDRTTCGAEIATGSGNVDIGGQTSTVLHVDPEVPLAAELVVATLGLVSGVGEIALAGDGLKLAKAAQLAKGLAGGLGSGVAGAVVGGAIWGQGSRGQRQLALGSGLVGGALASGMLAGEVDPMNARSMVADAPAEDPVAVASAKLDAARSPDEIEDARNTLKGLDYDDRKAVLNNFASKMDVSSAPNTATLYSGGRMMPTGPGGEMEWAPARSWAEGASATGRTTLEQTSGGGVLDKVDVFRTGDPILTIHDGSSVWDTASGRYADGASGDVHAYLDNPRSGSIYNTTEKPAVLNGINSGRVTSLKEFDLDNYYDWINK